jgi:cytochrome b561
MTDAASGQSARYDKVSASIHWLTALLILTAIPVIFVAENADRTTGLQLVFLHKSLGLTVFALTLVRIVWRIGHRAPPAPPMPGWQAFAAWAAHLGLYGLMLALPVSGYLLSSKSPFPLLWFGVEVPRAPVAEVTAEAANAAHEALGLVAIVLIVLHLGAALYHQFVMRDGLVARMRLRG